MVFTNSSETFTHTHGYHIRTETDFPSFVSKVGTKSNGCDFVPILPVELSLNIYSKLELKDLLNCSQVSRSWNKLTTDPLLWYRFCYHAGLVDDSDCTARSGDPFVNISLPSKKETSTLVSNSSSSHPSSPSEVLAGSDYHVVSPSPKVNTDWRIVYRCYLQTQCNWRNGRPSSMFALAAHHNRVITCMVAHKDWVITGSEDFSIDVWSLTRRTRLISLFGHRGGVWSLEVLPCTLTASTSSRPHGNHPLLISGSCDRTGRVWLMDDAQQWPCIATLFGHQSTIRCIASPKLVRTPVNRDAKVGESAMPRLVVTGSRDTTLRLWDADNGQCIHVLTVVDWLTMCGELTASRHCLCTPRIGHRGAVRSVQFTGDLIASGSYDCTVRLWCSLTGHCLHRLTGHTDSVYTLLFDGHWVISASLDTTIRVWQASSGQLLTTLIGHQSLTCSMVLAPETDQPRLLVSSNADGTIRVWNMFAGICLHVLAGPNKHQSAVTDVQLTVNFIISSSDDGTVKLWDRSNGAYIRDLIRLDAAGRGAVVWRLLAISGGQLICAAGSRNELEASKVVVLQFDSPLGKPSEHNCAFPLRPTSSPKLSELLADYCQT